jgi:hypothetical protein
MRTSTRTSAFVVGAVVALVGVAGCGADKQTSAMCTAWGQYLPVATSLDDDSATPSAMLDTATSGLGSLHQMRTVADETDADAVDDVTASLNALITALRRHQADVETERLDFLDAHQTLADLVVDECSR